MDTQVANTRPTNSNNCRSTKKLAHTARFLFRASKGMYTPQTASCLYDDVTLYRQLNI